DPGLDQKIVFLGAISADFAEGDLQAFGANAGGLRQHLAEIAFDQGEAAESSKRCLLSKKPLDILGGMAINGISRSIARGGRLEDKESVGEGLRALAGLDDLLDDLQGANKIGWPVRFAQARFAIGIRQADLTDIADIARGIKDAWA